MNWIKQDSPQDRKSTGNSRASLGKSVHVRGNVTADEDLTIEGTVDGKVVVKNHSLTIGPEAHVTKQVRARSVTVAGELRGNVTADDKVELAASGTMRGDIRAPRVSLADGSNFKGSIEMESERSRSRSGEDKTPQKPLPKTA